MKCRNWNFSLLMLSEECMFLREFPKRDSFFFRKLSENASFPADFVLSLIGNEPFSNVERLCEMLK